jgi:hypothetical protein
VEVSSWYGVEVTSGRARETAVVIVPASGRGRHQSGAGDASVRASVGVVAGGRRQAGAVGGGVCGRKVK